MSDDTQATYTMAGDFTQFALEPAAPDEVRLCHTCHARMGTVAVKGYAALRLTGVRADGSTHQGVMTLCVICNTCTPDMVKRLYAALHPVVVEP